MLSCNNNVFFLLDRKTYEKHENLTKIWSKKMLSTIHEVNSFKSCYLRTSFRGRDNCYFCFYILAYRSFESSDLHQSMFMC